MQGQVGAGIYLLTIVIPDSHSAVRIASHYDLLVVGYAVLQDSQKRQVSKKHIMQDLSVKMSVDSIPETQRVPQ